MQCLSEMGKLIPVTPGKTTKVPNPNIFVLVLPQQGGPA